MWLKKVTRYREYSVFGKMIKKGLVDKDMTATELAYLLGIKPQYLNAIVHGEKTGEKYKDKICKILEIEQVA